VGQEWITTAHVETAHILQKPFEDCDDTPHPPAWTWRLTWSRERNTLSGNPALNFLVAMIAPDTAP
jgi:hypothetical protein